MSSPLTANDKDLIQKETAGLQNLTQQMGQIIVGQRGMVRALLMGLLSRGHILLEGLPGLAKTLAVKTFSQLIEAQYQRIQFTPDLLPSDLLGTMIYREKTGEFSLKKGPIFTQLLLADEINRAPAKVQSALLEAMAERQVTIGETTHPLQEPFLVLATQNPLELEGTYPLSEAQLDRFLFKVKIDYPSREEERQMLDRVGFETAPKIKSVLSCEAVLKLRGLVERVYVDDRIREYILRIVFATRPAFENAEANEKMKQIRDCIEVGGSPRATLAISRAAQALALIEGRHYVIPEDIKEVTVPILRHRLILTYEAQSSHQSTDDVIGALLQNIAVP